MQPIEALAAGNELLADVLRPAGFLPESIGSGHGSGGPFATTRWTRGDQVIELSFRVSLGMVVYWWGYESYDHRHVVRALGVTTSYPGFSTEPLDAFRHLAADLDGPLAPILVDRTSATLARVRSWRPTRELP